VQRIAPSPGVLTERSRRRRPSRKELAIPSLPFGARIPAGAADFRHPLPAQALFLRRIATGWSQESGAAQNRCSFFAGNRQCRESPRRESDNAGDSHWDRTEPAQKYNDGFCQFVGRCNRQVERGIIGAALGALYPINHACSLGIWRSTAPNGYSWRFGEP
jgi:hypothetical protein